MGFEKESVNRGRREKSRLKKEGKLTEAKKFRVYDTNTGKTINYNNFYGDDNFFPSTFNAIINGIPDTVKSFKTLNYEGSQSR